MSVPLMNTGRYGPEFPASRKLRQKNKNKIPKTLREKTAYLGVGETV